MARRTISFRLPESLIAAAKERAEKLGFKHLGEYVERLIDCDLEGEFTYYTVNAPGGVRHYARVADSVTPYGKPGPPNSGDAENEPSGEGAGEAKVRRAFAKAKAATGRSNKEKENPE